MASGPSTPVSFTPFPRHSVNLLTGPTSIGKTTYIRNIIENRHLFFQTPINRIFIVLCNERVQEVPLQSDLDIPVEQIPLSLYEPELLQEHDLVVIDDIQKVTEHIRLTISVCAHHYNLASLFVVTHSLLNHSNFELLSLCHRVFLFLRASSNTRLSKYILSNFFQEPEVKEALTSIINFCLKEEEVLALELNAPASTIRDKIKYIAFSHLTNLITKGFCYIYPNPQALMDYNDSHIHLRVEPELAELFREDTIPKYALVAVPTKAIIASKVSPTVLDEEHPKCTKQEQWKNTVDEIEELIESNFKTSRWTNCKALAVEILRNKKFCVYTDGRYFQLIGRPDTRVALLEFLGVATRPAHKTELSNTHKYKVFKKHAQEIREFGSLPSLIKNKLL